MFFRWMNVTCALVLGLSGSVGILYVSVDVRSAYVVKGQPQDIL